MPWPEPRIGVLRAAHKAQDWQDVTAVCSSAQPMLDRPSGMGAKTCPCFCTGATGLCVAGRANGTAGTTGGAGGAGRTELAIPAAPIETDAGADEGADAATAAAGASPATACGAASLRCGHQTRTPISASMARWRSSRSNRVGSLMLGLTVSNSSPPHALAAGGLRDSNPCGC